MFHATTLTVGGVAPERQYGSHHAAARGLMDIMEFFNHYSMFQLPCQL